MKYHIMPIRMINIKKFRRNLVLSKKHCKRISNSLLVGPMFDSTSRGYNMKTIQKSKNITTAGSSGSTT